MKETQTPELQVPNLRARLSWLSLGKDFLHLTITQEEDGPTRLLLIFIHSYVRTSLSNLLASVALPLLTYFSLSWFCLFPFSFWETPQTKVLLCPL